MEIVIKIPEVMYEGVKLHRVLDTTVDYILKAIENGTPLPAEHGNLIDFNSLEEVAERMRTPYGTSGYGVFVDDIREYVRPIIASVEKGAEK